MRASAAFACALAVMGCRKQDPLFCANHEDPRCGNIDGGVDAAPDAPPGYVTIGGNVDGLAGTGLVLQNESGDDLPITVSGTFQFVTPIQIGQPYKVTASAQPTAVTQNCTVDPNGASGTAMTNVMDVHVTCTTVAFPVSGAVVGLDPDMMTDNIKLTLNGVDPQIVDVDGAFAFDTAIESGAGYDVEVMTTKGTKTCKLAANSGTIGNNAVSDVQVNCDPSLFTLSGMVTGLNGTVGLTDGHGTDNIMVAANGGFAFPPVPAGSYAINVSAQPMWSPTTPAQQTCSVTATANPVVTNADINTIAVTCTTNTYPVGGNVYDLIGSVTLADNGGDNDTVTATGPFTFATPVASGMTYLATVKTQPAGQTCIVSNPNGTIQAAAITDISVVCDSGLQCGTGFCGINTANNLCCGAGTGAAMCLKSSDHCGSSTEISCANATDCAVAGHPTNVCCATISSGHVSSTACSATCGGGDVTLCDPNVPGVCASGTCKPYSTLSGYYACQ